MAWTWVAVSTIQRQVSKDCYWVETRKVRTVQDNSDPGVIHHLATIADRRVELRPETTWYEIGIPSPLGDLGRIQLG